MINNVYIPPLHNSGIIKKAVREGAGVKGAPPGTVRVTFEDKPLGSDIVFLRAWVQASGA